MLGVLVASVLAGQPCAVRTYATTYAQPTYYAPTYQAAAVFQADPAYYTAAVAQYVRAQAADAAKAQAQADLTAKIDTLTATIARLQAPQQPVQFQLPYASPQQPQQPVYQQPAAPSKNYGSPQQPLEQPQIPDKSPSAGLISPSAGSVPPPPQPSAPFPGRPGADGFLPNMGYQQSSYNGNASVSQQPGDVLATVFQRNRCASCHTGSSASGGVKLFEQDGTLANLDFSTLVDPQHGVIAAVNSGRMPKGGQPMPPGDRAAMVGAVRQQIMAVASSLGGGG